jgi:hypothetical protein
MNVGFPDLGEYLQLKIDGNVFYTHTQIPRESLVYCCENFGICHANLVSWPEVAEYYSETHTASTFTLSIYTNLDENIDN